MHEFLRYKFLDNNVESYLYVVGVFLLVFIAKRLVSRFVAGRIVSIIINKSLTGKKAVFVNQVIKPIEKFLLVFIAYTALDRLYFPEALKIKFYHGHVTTEYIVNIIAVTVLVTVFIQLCIRILGFFTQVLKEKAHTTENKTDNQLIVFFSDFFKVILIIIGILLVIKFGFDKEIGSVLTGLSLVGAAIALATKESLENLIASFIIFFDKPFSTGDVVKVQSFTGAIEKIGLRSTRIRTEQKTYISVPNKQMVDTIVDNISLRTQRRIELRLEIGLNADADKLKKFSADIKLLLSQHPEIENSFVYLTDTGKNAHVFAVDYFTIMPQDIISFNLLRETIALEIIELISRSGLQLAASTLDVTVKNG
jgi:MscS family membrane protein